MKIKELTEDIDWPVCEAKLSRQVRNFWRGRSRPGNPEGKETCGCYARYRIGKKYFCRKHAGLYVLDKTIEEQQ